MLETIAEPGKPFFQLVRWHLQTERSAGQDQCMTSFCGTMKHYNP